MPQGLNLSGVAASQIFRRAPAEWHSRSREDDATCAMRSIHAHRREVLLGSTYAVPASIDERSLWHPGICGVEILGDISATAMLQSRYDFPTAIRQWGKIMRTLDTARCRARLTRWIGTYTRLRPESLRLNPAEHDHISIDEARILRFLTIVHNCKHRHTPESVVQNKLEYRGLPL